VLRSDPEVMKCHVTAWSARFFSEFGATAAILKSGFAIDSLLQRWVRSGQARVLLLVGHVGLFEVEWLLMCPVAGVAWL
jgi:hypothetical protein